VMHISCKISFNLGIGRDGFIRVHMVIFPFALVVSTAFRK
jgi:hypothetical protein